MSGLEVLKIDKDVPIPPYASGRNTTMYPFKTMEIGDSFEAAKQARRSLRSLAAKRGRELQKKFITRLTETGVRVWRVE